MYWAILLASAVFESVWAVALGLSEGFTNPWPTALFFIALLISIAGLGIAVKEIPIGTGYAVWVGVGASLTVIYSMVTGAEDVSLLKIVFITGIILAVVGLKFTESKPL